MTITRVSNFTSVSLQGQKFSSHIEPGALNDPQITFDTKRSNVPHVAYYSDRQGTDSTKDSLYIM